MKTEHQLISTIAANPELLTTVDVLADDFSDDRAGKVFETIKNLINEGLTPDAIITTERLMEAYGGEWIKSVYSVFDQPAIPANLKAYERGMKQDRLHRELSSIADQLIYDVDARDEHAATNAITNLKKLSLGSSHGIQSVSSAVNETIQLIDDRSNGRIAPGISTGLYDLDRVIGGLHDTDSVIIAARTGVGKTAFMCNLALNANCPAGIISGEQSIDQIITRFLAKIGGISAQRMRAGGMQTEDYTALVNAGGSLADSEIFIFDKPSPSIDDIERSARKMCWENNIKVLFVDYLQLIKNRAYPDMRLQISDISKRLKSLARELEIPVVTLAQLNRNAADGTPRVSDLKESGAIEEDADQIILLYQETDGSNELMVDLQKNRHGPKGRFTVLWEPKYMRIRNMQ